MYGLINVRKFYHNHHEFQYMIGKVVSVVIDRPYGSEHPVYSYIYPLNYGYIDGILAGDGEYQDAYVLGVSEPLDIFEGEVIAIIRRKDDVEDKWVVAKKGSVYTKEEIEKETWFQEQWFLSNVIMED